MEDTIPLQDRGEPEDHGEPDPEDHGGEMEITMPQEDHGAIEDHMDLDHAYRMTLKDGLIVWEKRLLERSNIYCWI